jgi:hypothetical protein
LVPVLGVVAAADGEEVAGVVEGAIVVGVAGRSALLLPAELQPVAARAVIAAAASAAIARFFTVVAPYVRAFLHPDAATRIKLKKIVGPDWGLVMASSRSLCCDAYFSYFSVQRWLFAD